MSIEGELRSWICKGKTGPAIYEPRAMQDRTIALDIKHEPGIAVKQLAEEANPNILDV